MSLIRRTVLYDGKKPVSPRENTTTPRLLIDLCTNDRRGNQHETFLRMILNTEIKEYIYLSCPELNKNKLSRVTVEQAISVSFLIVFLIAEFVK